jgi:hypothetical protein
MKAQLRNKVAALLFLAPAAATFSALPASAWAQTAAPEVYSFQVASDGGLDPGSRLRFTVQGTPHGQAFIHVRGIPGEIPLVETERGIYTGRYVIRHVDHVDENSAIRATLRRGDVTVATNYSFPAGIGNVATLPPAVPSGLHIERFHMAAQERIEPGAVLHFTVDGMPGAVAMVDLPGAAPDIRLHEMRPGHYEGSYTIRRTDNLNMSGPVVATLRQGDRMVTATLANPVVAAGPVDVPIHILSHSNRSRIDGNTTHVRGRTAPYAQVDVRVDAAPPVAGQFGVARQVFAETLQADPDGYFDFRFTSPYPMPGTRYDVSMVASKADVTNEARLTLFQGQS